MKNNLTVMVMLGLLIKILSGKAKKKSTIKRTQNKIKIIQQPINISGLDKGIIY